MVRLCQAILHPPDSTEQDRLSSSLRIPIVAVCGVSGVGKTALATRLASTFAVAHLSADVVHKELLGLRPTERAPEHVHTAELARRTYAELGRRAAAASEAIVDATFLRRAYRRAFADAYGAGPQPFFVECRADPAVLRARAARRLRESGNNVSDATPAVMERQLREFEPIDEVPAERYLVVETDRPLEEVVAVVSDALRTV